MRKTLYLVLCIAGTVLPYYQFIPYVREHGLDLTMFFQLLFANKVSGFFGMDVIVSSLVLWVFVYSEGPRAGMRQLWVYIVCNLLVGVSLAFPLFLLMRESKMSQAAPQRT